MGSSCKTLVKRLDELYRLAEKMSSDLTIGMDQPIARLLLDRFRWADKALRGRLAAKGWPEMTPAQSLVFASIDLDGTRPSELARRIGVSRQAVHQTIAELVSVDLLTLVADPQDGRAKLAVVTDEGRRNIAAAQESLDEIEADLQSRIGSHAVAALRAALSADWGSPDPEPDEH
jgi:DNA-binding MarR family transcriptional regulator